MPSAAIQEVPKEDTHTETPWPGKAAAKKRELGEKPSTDVTQKSLGAVRLGSESTLVTIKGNMGCLSKSHTCYVLTNNQMEAERPSFLKAATVTQGDKSQGQVGSAWPVMPQKTEGAGQSERDYLRKHRGPLLQNWPVAKIRCLHRNTLFSSYDINVSNAYIK